MEHRDGEAGTTTKRELILGIETSCDETAAAVVANGSEVMSNIVSSQIDIHARYGGVVPEVASRAHVEMMTPVVAEAMVEAGVEPADLTAIAATVGPGLIGSLLIGVSTAKSLSLAWNKPFVAVNHLEAHLYASFLEDPDLELPVIVLLVSGGHTMLILMEGHGHYRLLGQTLDDAAGEAYDKVARYLGLGYPGGPIIDKMAADGDPEAVKFPRAMMNDGYDFSFSGLKTSVVNYVRKNPDVSDVDIAASFQAAVADVLLTKARRAVQEFDAKGLCLAGGVAANSALRAQAEAFAAADGVNAFIPNRSMCTDNAAMIASAGWWRYHSDGPAPLDHGADSSLKFPAVS